MARGIPAHDGSYDGSISGGGGGSQYITRSYSSSLISDSFYHSSSTRGAIGDVFFGSDDIKDTRDLAFKEDVLESYRRETVMKSLRRRSKKESISNVGCVEFLKLLLRYCCRCII
ncbi:hypothetical protein HRI_001331600 [Hibiscus trionum]|uniref:Uncharacterized protein n=1 Tax=Hibiscus trionum TaxID=183268 RepID=A0A9W7LU13_HIBTR|nr:hypothetical protein HRI_001331600 [Hibiscus trionum]